MFLTYMQLFGIIILNNFEVKNIFLTFFYLLPIDCIIKSSRSIKSSAQHLLKSTISYCCLFYESRLVLKKFLIYKHL